MTAGFDDPRKLSQRRANIKVVMSRYTKHDVKAIILKWD
jgi:hypothetical protein